MIRWILVLFILAAVLTMTRFIVIAIRQPAERTYLSARLGAPPDSAYVQDALDAWRTRLGRKLWINLVAIPLALFLILILIGEFA